jgi:hypothetical protein
LDNYDIKSIIQSERGGIPQPSTVVANFNVSTTPELSFVNPFQVFVFGNVSIGVIGAVGQNFTSVPYQGILSEFLQDF